MKKIMLLLITFLILTTSLSAKNIELVIGKEKIKPGIVFIFEGAIKDHIHPQTHHLKLSDTNVHIEARVNWDEKNIPIGTPPEGFVPYLHITARVINEKTGLSTYIDVLPHVNLVDNFHYARNISLPGSISDTYTVIFTITPPSGYDVALHQDWVDTYGEVLFADQQFTYKKVNFEHIAKATRARVNPIKK